MQPQKASVSMFAVVVALTFGSALAFRKQNTDNSEVEVGDSGVADSGKSRRWRPDFGALSDGVSKLGDGVSKLGDGVKKFIPDSLKPDRTYACEVTPEIWTDGSQTPGDLDRWISVTPDLSFSKRAKQWLDLKEWGSWVSHQVKGEEQESPYSYDPFILRNRTAYGGRLLLKTSQRPVFGDGDPCIASYQASCTDDKLQLIKHETCGMNPETTEVLNLGSFQKEHVFCVEEGSKPSWYSKGKPAQDVFVLDPSGEAKAVITGNCVKIATVNPTKGVELHDIDPDLMGNGFLKLDGNESKLDALLATVKYTVTKQVTGAIDMVNSTYDAVRADLSNATDELNSSVLNGSVVAGKTSLKWASKAILDSMVDSCLCCDSTETFDVNESLGDHCKAAYTLGGENKSQPLTYLAKATIGSGYNFAKKAGSWVVPVIGGTLVAESQKMACKFACSMREPKFEPYEFGRVRKVPGLAVQTWFIPLP